MAGRAGEDRLRMYKRREPLKQEVRRKQAAADRRELRDTRRTEAFTARRGLLHKEPAANSRQQKLEEWKKRRGVPQKVEEKPKKPIFVVGKITYNDMHLYKPPESTVFRPPKGLDPIKPPPSVRSLRSNTRNRQKGPSQAVKEAIGAFTFAMNAQSAQRTKTPVETEDISELLNRTFDGKQTNSVEHGRQINLENDKIVQMVPSDALERSLQNNSPILQTVYPGTSASKSAENCQPVQNVKKSQAKQEILGQISEEKSAEYFRKLYHEAVAKLNSLCTEWTGQQTQALSDAINDDINVAVGYAQLLISQKLQQFLDLIVEHENTNSSTDLKVLTTDLDGFWNMVNNQVEDIYRKFEKLQTLKQNNWQNLSDNSMPVRQLTHNNAPKPKVIKSKGNATSGLRSFLAQARRQARIGSNENRKPAIDLLESSSIEMPRPMSPVVMRVASRVKQLGSPKIVTPSVTKARSPLHVVQSEAIGKTPKSSKKTPAHKRILLNTPGSTPLRRSTRLQHQVNTQVD